VPAGVIVVVPAGVIGVLPLDVVGVVPLDVIGVVPLDVIGVVPLDVIGVVPLDVIGAVPLDVIGAVPLDVIGAVPVGVVPVGVVPAGDRVALPGVTVSVTGGALEAPLSPPLPQPARMSKASNVAWMGISFECIRANSHGWCRLRIAMHPQREDCCLFECRNNFDSSTIHSCDA